MQSAVNIDEEKISLAYRFAYRLCGNRKVAEKLTELALIARCSKVQDDNLSLLQSIWQEFMNNYSFIEFKEGKGIQKVLLNLPVELRGGVILKDLFKYDYHQVAKILSISPQEAQKIVAQGRRKAAAYRI